MSKQEEKQLKLAWEFGRQTGRNFAFQMLLEKPPVLIPYKKEVTKQMRRDSIRGKRQ